MVDRAVHNVFSGGSLAVDRCNNERGNVAFLKQALESPRARLLPFVNLDVVVLTPTDSSSSEGHTATQATKLHWVHRAHPMASAALSATDNAKPVFLGRVTDPTDLGDVGEGDWLWAFPVTQEQLDQHNDEAKPMNVRTFALALASRAEAAITAQARSLLEFLQRHRFCGQCGSAVSAVKGGIELQCTAAPQCGGQWFPRSDPVVIAAVVDPATKSVLLGRQSRFPPGVWSALAGFMEHGESAEEAVRREVVEESGVRVGACRYHSSQPWPFPYSLMLGFVAEAVDTAITVDENELEDARWFTPQQVRAMLANCTKKEGLRIPPAGAIAHQLILDHMASLS